MTRTILALAVAVLAVCGATECQAQGKGSKALKVKILKQSRVYYPTAAVSGSFKKVGLVSCGKILNGTKEYKEIAQKGIRKGSAAYDLLVKRASDRFKKAIRTTVSLGGYDLVAEKGAVTVEGKTLPDITSEVLKNLPTS